jgi:HTH-type transcriptional regulator / antitoxin HigA
MSTNSIGRDRVSDRYLDLVREFPLRPIRTENEVDIAIKRIDSFPAKPALDAAEEDYLDVLGDLVKRFESQRHPLTPVTDAEMLKHLIEAKDVTQTEVSQATGIVVSTISDVLRGKRTLSRKHIGKPAKYLAVAPTVFAFDD